MSFIALLILASPFEPLPARDCFTQPLELRLTDLAAFGDLSREVAARHCVLQHDERLTLRGVGTMTVARTRLGRFRLFGQSIGYGIDVTLRPGGPGELDSLYAGPALDLPPAWREAIDSATTPLVVVGGAAVLTGVIIKLIGR